MDASNSNSNYDLNRLFFKLIFQNFFLLFYDFINFCLYHINIITTNNHNMFASRSISLMLLLLGFLVCSSVSISVDTNNTLFLDQYGRYAVFHGVNAIQKLFPFYPKLDHFDSNYSLADMDLANLKGWGLNVIRLHVAWEGVEPKKGVYNYTYI